MSSYQDDEEVVPFDGHAGSFPKEFGYGAFDGDHDVSLSTNNEQKPRILLMGLRRYGVREDQDTTAFDEQSSSLIKLNNGTVLYLREVNKFLALVCILREDNFDHKGVIDYNFFVLPWSNPTSVWAS